MSSRHGRLNPLRRRQIAVLIYAALFLSEQHLDPVDLLRAKDAAGCQVHLALGDPTSRKLLERGAEETFGTGIVSRAELALKHYMRHWLTVQASRSVSVGLPVQLALRFDDALLVNTHVWGLSAYSAPVLHLRRLVAGGVFDTYAQSFEAMWQGSTPAYPAAWSGG